MAQMAEYYLIKKAFTLEKKMPKEIKEIGEIIIKKSAVRHFRERKGF